MKYREIHLASGSGIHEKGIDPELKPCPFCKGTDVCVTNTHTICYWVECNDCSAQGPCAESADPVVEVSIETLEQATEQHRVVMHAAIEFWNDRGEVAV